MANMGAFMALEENDRLNRRAKTCDRYGHVNNDWQRCKIGNAKRLRKETRQLLWLIAIDALLITFVIVAVVFFQW